MTETPKRAALYARISETVIACDKVADQVAQLRRLAASSGYVVVAEFTDDGISALDADTLRPGFEALLLATVGGEFDIILATEEERLARNQIDKEELVDACNEHGVTWETMRDGAVDPSTETGEFFLTMRTAIARMESRPPPVQAGGGTSRTAPPVPSLPAGRGARSSLTWVAESLARRPPGAVPQCLDAKPPLPPPEKPERAYPLGMRAGLRVSSKYPLLFLGDLSYAVRRIVLLNGGIRDGDE